MAAGVRAVFGPCRQVAGLVPRLRDGMSTSSRPLAARTQFMLRRRARAHALTSSPGSVRRVLQLAGLRFATSMDTTGSSQNIDERLRRRRERERTRRAGEMAEQREHRLRQRRERDRAIDWGRCTKFGEEGEYIATNAHYQ